MINSHSPKFPWIVLTIQIVSQYLSSYAVTRRNNNWDEITSQKDIKNSLINLPNFTSAFSVNNTFCPLMSRWITWWACRCANPCIFFLKQDNSCETILCFFFLKYATFRLAVCHTVVHVFPKLLLLFLFFFFCSIFFNKRNCRRCFINTDYS